MYGFKTYEDAKRVALEYSIDQQWEPLQCIGCSEWFPVHTDAINTLLSIGYSFSNSDDIRMTCKECMKGE